LRRQCYCKAVRASCSERWPQRPGRGHAPRRSLRRASKATPFPCPVCASPRPWRLQ
jgi:hypothetical protein